MAEARQTRIPDGREALACAALRPALGSVLVYDATPAALDEIAAVYRDLLAAVVGRVETVRLGPSHTEDDLWGFGAGLPAPWYRPGLLLPPEGCTYLMVVPDLANLSLAASRAAVVLMDAEVGHLERHGQSVRFRPRLRWLAACPREKIGRVSPHLLDRFALRLRQGNVEAADGIEALSEALQGRSGAVSAASDKEVERLRGAAGRRPVWARAALREVTSFKILERSGMRRELALAQTAQAFAQLTGAVQVMKGHVREAAALFGFSESPAPLEVEVESRPQDRPAVQSAPSTPLEEPVAGPETGDAATPADGPATTAPQVGPEVTFPAVPLPSPELPEAAAPVERDHAPLTLPVRQARANAQGRGAILGIRRAASLKDVSIFGTVFAALSFQTVRREAAGPEHKDARLIVAGSDLREYRRAPVVQELLVLVVDFTCLVGRDWHTAILPYLTAAYRERAEVCLVSVGAMEAPEPLRAERLSVRSVLVPSFAAALEREPGKATPLADGLALARDAIRRSVTHGRHAVRRVTLVVLTDGRGNVPLAASREGRILGTVARQGVDDACRVAQELRGIEHVESVVLDPRPSELGELPYVLAEALGAEVVSVPRPSTGAMP